jgi:hypothetical protein
MQGTNLNRHAGKEKVTAQPLIGMSKSHRLEMVVLSISYSSKCYILESMKWHIKGASELFDFEELHPIFLL